MLVLGNAEPLIPAPSSAPAPTVTHEKLPFKELLKQARYLLFLGTAAAGAGGWYAGQAAGYRKALGWGTVAMAAGALYLSYAYGKKVGAMPPVEGKSTSIIGSIIGEIQDRKAKIEAAQSAVESAVMT